MVTVGWELSWAVHQAPTYTRPLWHGGSLHSGAFSRASILESQAEGSCLAIPHPALRVCRILLPCSPGYGGIRSPAQVKDTSGRRSVHKTVWTVLKITTPSKAETILNYAFTWREWVEKGTNINQGRFMRQAPCLVLYIHQPTTFP